MGDTLTVVQSFWSRTDQVGDEEEDVLIGRHDLGGLGCCGSGVLGWHFFLRSWNVVVSVQSFQSCLWLSARQGAGRQRGGRIDGRREGKEGGTKMKENLLPSVSATLTVLKMIERLNHVIFTTPVPTHAWVHHSLSLVIIPPSGQRVARLESHLHRTDHPFTTSPYSAQKKTGTPWTHTLPSLSFICSRH
jgi:hypothetical protein